MYNFTLTGQRGTLWWHAHILWLRATVHGAIVILPKLGVPYPFPRPHMEQVLILSEFFYVPFTLYMFSMNELQIRNLCNSNFVL
jgi:hypothetical protein